MPLKSRPAGPLRAWRGSVRAACVVLVGAVALTLLGCNNAERVVCSGRFLRLVDGQATEWRASLVYRDASHAGDVMSNQRAEHFHLTLSDPQTNNRRVIENVTRIMPRKLELPFQNVVGRSNLDGSHLWFVDRGADEQGSGCRGAGGRGAGHPSVLAAFDLTDGESTFARETPPLWASTWLETLLDWMTGSFSSGPQAADDADYLDIRLTMVPIWTDRVDGPWLYVEQAAATSLDRPYRQRVYRLVAIDDEVFESVVYALPGDPLRFAGAWQDVRRFKQLSPLDLEERSGCTITLEWSPEIRAFVGGTDGKDCESSLRGAKSATSEAAVYANRLVSWDRGYAENDEQVWGSTKGGYVFTKLPPTPVE